MNLKPLFLTTLAKQWIKLDFLNFIIILPEKKLLTSISQLYFQRFLMTYHRIFCFIPSNNIYVIDLK